MTSKLTQRFLISRCESQETQRYQFFLNQKPITFPWCDNNQCDLKNLPSCSEFTNDDCALVPPQETYYFEEKLKLLGIRVTTIGFVLSGPTVVLLGYLIYKKIKMRKLKKLASKKEEEALSNQAEESQSDPTVEC